jgi:hypothetical protein
MQQLKVKIEDAGKTKKKMVCSICWSHLLSYPIKGDMQHVELRCSNRNCQGDRGMVTKAYADRRHSTDAAEYVEAKRNLGIALGLVQPARKEQDIMTELGF